MNESPTAYPLAWPQGKPRTPRDQRARGRFSRKESQYSGYRGSYKATRDLTVSVAVQRLTTELERIEANLPIISTNIELRRDGLPMSNRRAPHDPGVAVYFQHEGHPIVLACDRYETVEANIAAIAAHIEASRAIERHGVGRLSDVFRGFAALPPAMSVDDWRAVLDHPTTLAYAEVRYRELAKEAHPDRSGSEARMVALNAAIAKAREVLK